MYVFVHKETFIIIIYMYISVDTLRTYTA